MDWLIIKEKMHKVMAINNKYKLTAGNDLHRFSFIPDEIWFLFLARNEIKIRAKSRQSNKSKRTAPPPAANRKKKSDNADTAPVMPSSPFGQSLTVHDKSPGAPRIIMSEGVRAKIAIAKSVILIPKDSGAWFVSIV